MQGSVDPLELIKEDFKDEEVEPALSSIGRLPMIAIVMGPERTRNDLIPFLNNAKNLPDEALAALADQLGSIVPYLGGPNYAHLLLPILERLASQEETCLREAAVDALNKVVANMPAPDIFDKYMAMFRRLFKGEWFSQRVSTAGLIPPLYKIVPANIQEELRQTFNTLARDETPMVRRAAYASLPDLCKVFKPEHVRAEVLPVLRAISEDCVDFMRQMLASALPAYAAVLKDSPDEYKEACAPLIEAATDDTSWRVRQDMAKQFPAICSASGPQLAAAYVIPQFVRLLKDGEAEVRTSAVTVLKEVCSGVDQTCIRNLVGPCLNPLASDTAVNAKVAFSQSVMDLAPLLGKEGTRQFMLALFTQLSKDEDARVRCNVIAKFDVLADAAGVDMLSEFLLNPLLELMNDPKWRVRLEAVGRTAYVSKQLGEPVFDKKLKQALIASLSDSVHAIREATCEQVSRLIAVFGLDWFVKKFLPVVIELYDKSTNYLHRMVPLYLFAQVASNLPADIIQQQAIPIFNKACKDPVSNVRFAAAKTLGPVARRLDKSSQEKIAKPLLSDLATNDKDPDASFFASQSLKDLQT